MLPEDADRGRATLDGDQEAFGLLYDRYAGLIRAICFDTTRSVPCAQDLAQDVFLRAYEKLRALRRHAKFPAWLVGIARQRCREWRRGRAKDRQRNVALDAEQLPAAETHGNDGVSEHVKRAMSLLSEKERVAVHAFYLLDESASDVRAGLGLSKSGFYRLLERARKRLRRYLADPEDLR